MSVFLVTEGEYSYYSVVGAFSTREKAEKYTEYFKKHAHFDYDIEEYTLDPIPESVYRENKMLYLVIMYADGRIHLCYQVPPDQYELPRFNWQRLQMYVWATSEEHAIKIVNEKRTQYLANQMWKNDEKTW